MRLQRRACPAGHGNDFAEANLSLRVAMLKIAAAPRRYGGGDSTGTVSDKGAAARMALPRRLRALDVVSMK
ncbi:hypothetical protein [Achromobacter pulmonis]|uniref:hypothetical protein n=1 Tax=Achromobacter pulmonis TaxID=1389932 RepID=UPI0015828860|nr:hypothetical protein [Achromobacter pulmonis]